MPKPIIFPISRPMIDWNNYLKNVNDYCNRSPTRLLDKEHKPIGDLYSFIGSLGYFSQGKTPDEAIRYTPSLLKHLSFTFAIETSLDLSLELQRECNLTVTDNRVMDRNLLFIVSGTLFDWKTAILLFTNEQRSFDIRYIFDVIYLYFESLSLGGAFHNYSRSVFPDQTFSLEHKKS